MREVVALVLGGGRGTRLSPLTDYRAKPAVPLAGKYRLVDVPISNCIHSGIFRIFVLTQFESASLNRHLSKTYHFDQFHGGGVEVLAAEERNKAESGWFQGTADAVRQTLHHTVLNDVENVLILAGDALYRMDFEQLRRRHTENGADLTVACKTVDAAQATGFGVMQIDKSNKITSFKEKPGESELNGLEMDSETLRMNKLDDPRTPYLASMGIYMFKADLLLKILKETSYMDFGKEIIPSLIETHKVFASPFTDYWEDIGTIRSYYEANLELTDDMPAFNLYDPEKPIYTRQRFLPGSKMIHANAERTLVGEGCIVNGATLNRVVLGVRSIIRQGSVLENTVMNGADYYEGHRLAETRETRNARVPLGIGENCVIRNAIIDKNARIGNGVLIVNDRGRDGADNENYMIRDGLVIVKKRAVIPDGTVI